MLTLPDSLISHEKGEILVEYLEKVFCERCGMDLKVESVYVKVEESKYRKNSALQIQQEVSQRCEKLQENQGVQQAKQEEEEKKAEKIVFLILERIAGESGLPIWSTAGTLTRKAFRWRM